MTSDRETGAMGAVTGAQRLPLWFIEGMAEYLSIGALNSHTAMLKCPGFIGERLV
jgi:hypothetical protein